MNWAVKKLKKKWKKKFGKCNIEDFNFKRKMSYLKKFYSFQFSGDFSTDLDSHAIKFFETDFKKVYILI